MVAMNGRSAIGRTNLQLKDPAALGELVIDIGHTIAAGGRISTSSSTGDNQMAASGSRSTRPSARVTVRRSTSR